MPQTVNVKTGPSGVGQKFLIGPVTATKNGQAAPLPGPVVATLSGELIVTISAGQVPDTFEAISVDDLTTGQATVLITSGPLSDAITVNGTAGANTGDTLVVPLGPVELK